MRKILDLGLTSWVMIETQVEANIESSVTGNGTHLLFAWDVRAKRSGFAGARHFSLRTVNDGKAVVSVRVPRDFVEEEKVPFLDRAAFESKIKGEVSHLNFREDVIVSGAGGANPYLQFADEIGVLSKFLSIELPQECWPGMDMPLL